MKRLLWLWLLGVSFVLPAQPVTPGQQTEKQLLLDKSKQQKSTATILLVGGGIAFAAGAIWFSQEFSLFGPASDAETASIMLATAGGAAMVGSLILFSASSRNKRKANELAVDLQWEKWDGSLAAFRKAGFPCFPALGIRYRIR